jgi:tetratricopeptide (TPR) repeat protein
MAATRVPGPLGVVLLLGFAGLLPELAHGGCNSPLSTIALRPLDEHIDFDPVAVNLEVRRRLDALQDADPVQAAELYAIAADAYRVQDDCLQVLTAVAAARDLLGRVTEGGVKRALQIRLDITAADSPRSSQDMRASVDYLTELEQSLPTGSLDRTRLLIVRSRLNTQLLRDDVATADGIAAYGLAKALQSPAMLADAAYQLSLTYMRAGMLEDAESLAQQAAAYHRSMGQAARLSNALSIKADVFVAMHRYEDALAVTAEAQAIDAGLHQDVDVGFDDQQQRGVLLELQRLDAAGQACLDARSILAKAGRVDRVAAIEGSLARIDTLRGRPVSAIARLDRILGSERERVPARTLPWLYRYRADALKSVGRFSEALRDLQQASHLTDAGNAERCRLAAMRLKERAGADAITQQKNALEAQMRLERIDAANELKQSRLSLALAIAVGLLFVSLAYLMWNRARQERALRHAVETLDAQAHVIAATREGVLFIGDAGRIRYANPALLRMLARSGAEVLALQSNWESPRISCARRSMRLPAAFPTARANCTSSMAKASRWCSC